MESLSITNPVRGFGSHPERLLSMSLRQPPAILGFRSPRSPFGYRIVSIGASPLILPKGIAAPLRKRSSLVFSAAASHEDSVPSDINVEKEKQGLKEGAEESQEAWKETLASFREQAIKMQSVSQEHYEVYLAKATVILKETSENLKVQAEKARQDLSVLAKELGQESKEYLAAAAENYPEPVKDIVETFASSSDELSDISTMRDFYIGIPYGTVLSGVGFLSFMVTGSISAIRFGVILGGALLALSISSLRSWKNGKQSSLALKGQAAIATILFLRELRLIFVRPFIANFVMTLFSGVVVAFYAYKVMKDGGQMKRSSLEPGTEN